MTAIATDAHGQSLVAFESPGEVTVGAVHDLPCPLALVVVSHRGAVLLGLNRWRGEWELPGGLLEAGRSARAAAVRELAEETGVTLTQGELRFAGLATFDLVGPVRRELAAVFAADLDTWREPQSSHELVDVQWVDPAAPPDPHSPLDAAIACAVTGR